MAVTAQEFEGWIKRGIENDHKYMISVCDTFDYEDYPVYCDDEKGLEEMKAKYDGKEMQRINEIVNLDEHRK